MTLPTSFKLNTGASIPSVGLGTWQAPPGEVAKAVEHALTAGYRHLDCAFVYGNEAEVGQGIKASGIPRDEIFITTKVWNTYQDRVEECLDKSLQALGVDYVDLFLIHWPVRLVPNSNEPDALIPLNSDGSRATDREWNQQKTWAQLEKIYKEGKKVKAIGVSNFSIPYLKHLEEAWTVIPAVNQVENHPYCPQHDLVEFCKSKGIIVQAYSPLGSTNSPLLTDSVLNEIAEAHSSSPAKILISYQVQRGIVVLPKSVTKSRIEDNLQVIELKPEELEKLNELAAQGKQQRVNTPAFGWDLGFDDWDLYG
ncbi:glycerol dehydrogenase [Phaffia rhodozyma]|uniref:Glycerol dehydrogenase n=1 Tax=Phaffia rhodozyma TaxID=264483 RepID=A0A0F7SVX0_PHARH|nr:glycerol dehydrogenase [Phaffia rhodozyma]